MAPRIAIGIAALALLVSACGDDASTETTTAATTVAETDTTTPAERDEASLVLYSGRAEELVDPLIERFEAETGITVDVRYAGSGELATTLVQEGDQSPADVFWSQDPAFAGAVALAGLFEPLPADILELVPARFSDAEGRWVGVTARTRVFIHNPELVSELPADIWSLTDPSWSGQLGVAPTNGSFVAFVSGMVLAEGEERTLEWLQGIAANDPVIFDGNSPIVDAVNAGDVPAGLVNHYYLLRVIDEQGSATAVNHSFAAGDPGALVMPSGAGLVAGAENSEEGLEFIRFLLTEESQTYFLEDVFEYPLIEGIGAPAGQVPLEELPELDVEMSDLATVIDTATDLIAEAGLT